MAKILTPLPPDLTPEELRALAVKVDVQPSAPCNRLTTQFMMSHEACGNDPIQAPCSFSHSLMSAEQPYMRRFAPLREEWARIDLGWLADDRGISYIILFNKTTGYEKTFAAKPTLDGLDEARKGSFEVHLGGQPLSWVWPGRFAVIPNHPNRAELTWRAVGPGVHATVYAYPG